jgi:Ricin-type beta-trefoil lectin domain
MMRGIRRLVVYTAVSGLIAAGAVTASMQAAHADGVVARCIGAADSATAFQCPLSANVSTPSTMTVTVTDNSATANAKEDVTTLFTFTCSDANATSPQVKGGETGMTTLTESLTPLPATAADGTCQVSVTVSLPPNPTTKDPFTATLSYTSVVSASPSPSPSQTITTIPVHPVVGFGGKCLDDRGNSSSNRAQVVIWTCSGSDPAENWQFSNNEFIHNGKCLNDQGNGGIRSKVILWTCNGASNEKWSELANGEIRLQSHGNTLCLDDPRSSTQNGTQLIVYTCTDSSNQKWKHS